MSDTYEKLIALLDAATPHSRQLERLERARRGNGELSSSHATPRWRRQSRANPSLKRKFPASQGKYREFHSVRGSARVNGRQKRSRTRYLEANSLHIGTGNFLRPCRELNRGDQGNFRPDQGIPLSPAVLGDYSAAADKSNPPRHAVAFTMDKAVWRNRMRRREHPGRCLSLLNKCSRPCNLR